MPLLLLAVILAAILLAIALTPVMLIQRYRRGTIRRRARGWTVTLNAAGLALSSLFFLASAAFMSFWIPRAFAAAGAGFAAGAALGLVGLALTRWETIGAVLHYTPNRWLVLAVTLAVTARLVYGFWRGWQAWSAAADGLAWAAASGAAGSLGAGALVLGYYLTYWVGVRRRLVRGARRRGIA